MSLTERRIRQQNRDMAIKLMVPTAILAKLIYIYFLPMKYFFDSWRMVDMLNNGNEATTGWTGYQDAVNFHASINIFHLTEIYHFSIFYGLIMTPVMMIIVSRVIVM